MKDLYTAVLTNTNSRQPERIYTHAHSHLQAVRNFCTRFPYPPYVFDEVKNERSGLTLSREEYLQLERKR